jgi:hypothetical protein
MNAEVTTHEWKLINQCAKRELGRLGASTGLGLDWFINAGYVGLIERRKYIKQWNARYVWLAILDGIRRELRLEFDRRKQRDGSYITTLTFTDIDARRWTAEEPGDAPANFAEGLVSRESLDGKDAEGRELWDWCEGELNAVEYRVVRLWAERHTEDSIADQLDLTRNCVRYTRDKAIETLREVYHG